MTKNGNKKLENMKKLSRKLYNDWCITNNSFG